MAFTAYKTFTVDHLQCGSASSTDFPITIRITDADFATVANGGKAQHASGYDIRPFSDIGLTSALTFELVSYNAVTGAIEMHVKVPTLSSSVDLVLYLGIGNSALTTDGSSTGTWDSSFKGVWHLKDGTTLSGADSTAGAHTGTLTGSPTAAAGQINGAGNFDGSSQYISFADHADFEPGSGDFTISAWVNPDTNNTRDMILGKDSASRGYVFELNSNSAGTQVAGQVCASWTANGSTFCNLDSASGLVSTGVWTALTMVRSGSTALLYKNGASVTFTNTGDAPSTAVRDSTAAMEIARRAIGGGFSDYFDGLIDEVRLSFTARSASWILAEYNNQKASSTFLSWGSLVLAGSPLLGRLHTEGLFVGSTH